MQRIGSTLAFLSGLLIVPSCGGSTPAPEAPPAEPVEVAAVPAEPVQQPEQPPETPGKGPQVAPPPEVKKCAEMVPVEGGEGLIDDGEDADPAIPANAGRSGKWLIAHDDKGTKVEPSGNFAMAKGGADKTKQSARMKGKVSAEDGAWGATLSVTLKDAQPYDGSNYAGISFFAKVGKKSASAVRFNLGDAQTVDKGGVCTQCWNHFGKDLTLTPEWKKYTVSFAELTQQDGWGDPRPANVDPTRLWQLVWQVTEKGADFEVWVDQVQFLTCKQ